MDIQRKKKRKITKQKFKNESYKNRVLYYKTGRRRVKKKTQARERSKIVTRDGKSCRTGVIPDRRGEI